MEGGSFKRDQRRVADVAGLAGVDCNFTRGSVPGRSSQVGPEFGAVYYAPAGNQYESLTPLHTRISLFEGVGCHPSSEATLSTPWDSSRLSLLPFSPILTTSGPPKPCPDPGLCPPLPARRQGKRACHPGPHVSTPRWPRARGFPVLKKVTRAH